MSTTHHTKVLIIGSGPAGYTAAIYTARANLKPMLVAGMQPGGQMTITTDVENYPGFAQTIQGPWLMEQMRGQAEHVGTQMIHDTIVSVDLKSSPKKCVGDSGDIYLADTVIIATGAQAKWLGMESEQRYKGYGVSACATCDGFFYRGKEVVLVGGGNTAVEEAIFLTNFASKVTVVHRRDSFRAEKIMQERLFKNPKVHVLWDSVLEEVTGDGKAVNGVVVHNLKTGAKAPMKVDGVFIAIGHTPSTSLFKGLVDMDAEGYIITKPDSTATNIPGVFAAGDVKDKVYRQAVTAAGMGCMAALEADRWLAHHEAGEAAAKKTA
jgi:thioredoxin reductase (NADPH)